MDIPTYYTFVILTWILNGLFWVGLLVFLAKNGRNIKWVLIGIVLMPTLSFILAYLFNDIFMIPNLISSCIPLAAGAYMLVNDLYQTPTFGKYMKIHFLIIALLFVPSLSGIYVSTYYSAYHFGNTWFGILFMTLVPPFVAAGSMRIRVFNKNVLFGCLFGGIGAVLSLLFYFGRYILTLPGLEILGIVLFIVSFGATVLAFIGMLGAKGNPDAMHFEERETMGRYREFKRRERDQDFRSPGY